MMLTEIFVENNPVDVSEDISALLTFAIDDIKDFSARNTTWSKTIVLPGTSRNNDLFGNIFEVNNGNFYDETLANIGINFNAAKSASCLMFQGGIQVFKGIFRIMEIVLDGDRIEYECALFGELGGLIAKMGNSKLEDLDFSAYDHVYNTASISNSWDAAKGSGVYYPLIDYGTYSVDKKDWDIKTFRPALYVKEYIDKIFAAAGYTYQCDLFNTPRFKTLIIPHNQKALTKVSNTILDTQEGPGEILLDSSVPRTADSVALFTFHGGLFTQSTDRKTFTYTGTSPLTAHMSWNFSGQFMANGSTTMKIFLRKNGLIAWWDSRLFYGSPTMVNYSRSYTGVTIQLNPGDVFDLRAEVSFNDPGMDFRLDVNTSNLTFTTDTGTTSPVALGDTVNMNFTTPKNILQKDFLASIIKLFNLYVYEDKDQIGKILIKPYTDFMDTNLSNAVDWTYKIDRSKPIRVKPMSELNARYYEFKYKNDSDYYNDQYSKRYNLNYGDYILDTAYEMTQEKTTVELIFSGTPLVGYIDEAKVYPTIFKQSNGNEETIDSNIRIMQSKKVLGVPTWTIKNGATVLDTYTSYGYAGHLDDPDAPANDLNFGAPYELYFTLAAGALNVNQFNVYWSPYMSEVTDKDSRLLTAYVKLNAIDINNLDFSKYIYIDGILYTVNKIADYNAYYPDECQVTLLKVIDTNAIAAAPSFNIEDQWISFPATGDEGTTLTDRTLQNKIITALFCGDKLLVASTSSNPDVNEYFFDTVQGKLTFGVPLQAGQIIQILFRTS
jgi:hypothetical protein